MLTPLDDQSPDGAGLGLVDRCGALIGRITAMAVHHAWLTLAIGILLTLAAGYLAATRLAVDTDTTAMIDERETFRQHYNRYIAEFEDLRGAILIVVSAETAEVADFQAKRLSERLTSMPTSFRDVAYLPGLNYFRDNALLFIPPEQREQVITELASAQPLIASLARQPVPTALAELTKDTLDAIQRGDATMADLAKLDPIFEALAATIEGHTTGTPQYLSWQSILGAGHMTAAREEHLAVITLFPVLEPGALLPAERAVTEIRQIVEELEIGPGAGALAATVSLTGEPVLALEEMETVVIGAGRAGVISLVLVALILGFGLRSLTLIASVLFTLVTGLVMTAGLAAVVVGSLNLISVAFAVLFVGLAVDFGIHYSLRYREALAHAEYQEDALLHAGGRLGVGIPLSLCMLCTIIGFLSFLPTSYRGLAELGQIAALGMGVAFIGTITLLPALLSLFPAPSAIEIGSTSSNQGEPWFEKQAGKIAAACLVLTLVALPVAALISFDVNPLNLRDPESQSVETFNRLAADPLLTPYRAQLIAESTGAIGEFADDAAQSDEIGIVISALSFIPEQQDTALDALFDLGFLLGPSLDGMSEAGPLITTTSMREGLLALSSNLNAIPQPMPGLDRLMAALEAARPASMGSGELLTLHDLMARFLYPQLKAIGASLDAGPVTLDDLPAEILRDWRGKEGGYRVDVLPATPITSNTDIRAFAEAVAAIEPEATGTPAIITAASDAIAGAFVQATLITLALITLVLITVLRSLTSVTLALLPLVQAAVLAIAVAALAGQALNFANIIALPLLFALGVCSCIHMVWRQKQAQDDLSFTSVQQTTTPRAITLSAITTVASFGTLATSPHPGTASMGLLLTLSIAATLFTTLIFLPAAMAWLAKRKQQQSIDAALARHIGKQTKGTAKNEDPQP